MTSTLLSMPKTRVLDHSFTVIRASVAVPG